MCCLHSCKLRPEAVDKTILRVDDFATIYLEGLWADTYRCLGCARGLPRKFRAAEALHMHLSKGKPQVYLRCRKLPCAVVIILF